MVSDRLKFLFPITRQVFFQFKETILEFLFQEIRHLNSLNFYQKIIWFFFYRTNKTFSTFVQLKDYTQKLKNEPK